MFRRVLLTHVAVFQIAAGGGALLACSIAALSVAGKSLPWLQQTGFAAGNPLLFGVMLIWMIGSAGVLPVVLSGCPVLPITLRSYGIQWFFFGLHQVIGLIPLWILTRTVPNVAPSLGAVFQISLVYLLLSVWAYPLLQGLFWMPGFAYLFICLAAGPPEPWRPIRWSLVYTERADPLVVAGLILVSCVGVQRNIARNVLRVGAA